MTTGPPAGTASKTCAHRGRNEDAARSKATTKALRAERNPAGRLADRPTGKRTILATNRPRGFKDGCKNYTMGPWRAKPPNWNIRIQRTRNQISVPHPFAFLLAKGWETTKAKSRFHPSGSENRVFD